VSTFTESTVEDAALEALKKESADEIWRKRGAAKRATA